MYDTKSRLLAEVCEERLLSCENTLPEGFEFSEEFERRMSGIIGARQKPYLRGRLKAALVIAVIFAAGFCLGMGCEPIWNYIIKSNPDGSKNVTFDVGSIENPKRIIEEVYELAIPEDYELYDSLLRNDRTMQLWRRWHGGEGDIFFAQYIPEVYFDATFGGTAAYYFDDDGTQYYMDERDDGAGAAWERDGYVFVLSGSLNKDEVLRLCKTLKISKKRSEFSQIGQ